MANMVPIDRELLVAILGEMDPSAVNIILEKHKKKAAGHKKVHVHEKKDNKKKEDDEAEQCWATTAKDKQCKIDAAHKDGFCGNHHRMFKEGKLDKHGVPIEKKKMAQCKGKTKDVDRCEGRVWRKGDGAHCYQHNE